MAQFSADDPIVILSYARTPMGGMQGALSDVSATDLGATAVKAAFFAFPNATRRSQNSSGQSTIWAPIPMIKRSGSPSSDPIDS